MQIIVTHNSVQLHGSYFHFSDVTGISYENLRHNDNGYDLTIYTPGNTFTRQLTEDSALDSITQLQEKLHTYKQKLVPPTTISPRPVGQW